MAQSTANLSLTLPETYDAVDVSVLSTNFSKLDQYYGLLVKAANVANSLSVTAAGKVLDARQGKALNDKITNLTNTVSGKLSTANVYNALDKTVAGFALDARQGKALKELADKKTTTRFVTVSLTVAGWTKDSSTGLYKQEVSVAGITADASKTSAIASAPLPRTQKQEYFANEVQASSQSAGKVTFTASSVPTIAMSVNILVVGSGVVV